MTLSLETPRCSSRRCSRERLHQHTRRHRGRRFTSECVVLLKCFVRPKAVSVDGHRLLLAVVQQESNRRFRCGFRRDYVPFTTTTSCENKHRQLVFSVCSTSTVSGNASMLCQILPRAVINLIHTSDTKL